MVEAAGGWCRHDRVEPPFEGPLHRLVRAAQRQWEAQAFFMVSGRMSAELRAGIDDLTSGSATAGLAQLRADPGPVGVKSIDAELAKLDIAERVPIPADVLEGFTSQVLGQWARRFESLTLFAVGTNAGIRRIASSEPGIDTESDLHYVRRRYLSPTNLRRTITAVVNATHQARHETHWGHVTTTASDSTKFLVRGTRTCSPNGTPATADPAS